MQPTLPAGSVVIFHGRTWHGGGANHTDQLRTAMSDTTAMANGCASNAILAFADMAPAGQFKPNAFGLHDMTGDWEDLRTLAGTLRVDR